MRKKILVSIIIVLVLAILLFLNKNVFPFVSERNDIETVKIGWIGPLTGDECEWGQCELRTVKLLFEKINSMGGLLGKKLEIVGYDTKGDYNEAINAVKILTTKDKVIAILGPNSSNSALNITPSIEQAKIPCIATVATNPRVTFDNGKVKPYSFRVCFTDSYQGAVAAGFALNSLKLTNAAILYNSSDEYSTDLAKYFEEYYTKNGGVIVAKESFKSGDISFFDQLRRIKEAKPEIVFMPFYYKEVGFSATQAKQIGLNAVLLGGDGWISNFLYDNYAFAVNNSYAICHLDINSAAAKDLNKLYQEKYGSNIEIDGYLVHDAVMMLVEAIKIAGDFDSQKITAALEQLDIEGITGRIQISKYNHDPIDKEAVIIKIIDGEEKFIQYYTP